MRRDKRNMRRNQARLKSIALDDEFPFYCYLCDPKKGYMTKKGFEAHIYNKHPKG